MRRAFILLGWLAVAAPVGGTAPEPVEGLDQVQAEDALRVRLTGVSRAAVMRALAGAAARLEEPAARRCWGTSRWPRATSRPAASRPCGLTASEFLNVIVFARGARQGRCAEPGVLAVTTPGSRVVYVCEGRFAELAAADPETAEATLIHEALHSLGRAREPAHQPRDHAPRAGPLRRPGPGGRGGREPGAVSRRGRGARKVAVGRHGTRPPPDSSGSSCPAV